MMIALHLSESVCFRTSNYSHGFVWVEHDSHLSSHGSWWQVLSEVDSDGSMVSMGVDAGTPVNSESGVVHGVLSSEDVSDSSSKIESGSGFIVAVLDCNQCLTTVLGGLRSSESSEDTVLIESHRLGLLMLLFVLDFSSLFLCHFSLFVIMIIQYKFTNKSEIKKTMQNNAWCIKSISIKNTKVIFSI